MLEYYFAAMLARRQVGDLAYSALPDAPDQPPREDRRRGRNRPSQPPPAADHSQVPAGAGRGPHRRGVERVLHLGPRPCRQWGVCREDRHGCVAPGQGTFPELDQDLNAWETTHGWLYR